MMSTRRLYGVLILAWLAIIIVSIALRIGMMQMRAREEHISFVFAVGWGQEGVSVALAWMTTIVTLALFVLVPPLVATGGWLAIRRRLRRGER